MKAIIAIMAMVLLSTSAWSCDWCNNPEYQAQKLGIFKSGVSSVSSYPTEWKQYGSVEKYCAKKCNEQCMAENTNNETIDSRYRLENNEVSGEYRITEFKNGKWEEIENSNTWNCPNWQVPLSMCKRESEDRIRKYLERLKKQEQQDKAWRPIK